MQRLTMVRRIAPVAVLAILGVLTPALPAGAQSAAPGVTTSRPEPLVQNARPPRAARARPRIRVHPRYPYRSYHTLYPPPYDAEYPGPNAVRRCTSRLVTEHRPSGTVIVPRMRCWWAQR